MAEGKRFLGIISGLILFVLGISGLVFGDFIGRMLGIFLTGAGAFWLFISVRNNKSDAKIIEKGMTATSREKKGLIIAGICVALFFCFLIAISFY